MKSLRLFGLGVRAAWAGGTAGVVRVLLMSIGLAVGVALLLGALSVSPAISARHVREDARIRFSSSQARRAEDATFVWSFIRNPGDDPIEVDALRGRGNAPIPPGIPALPGAGEVYASPALAALLASPEGTSLVPLVGGKVVGTIDEPGLLDPGELLAYTGAPPEIRVRPGEWPVTRFGGFVNPGPPLSLPALMILVVFVVGMLLPIAIFVVATVRLAASTRETRLAAIRLAGATQGQIRLLAGAESVLPAVIACALAWPLFLIGRGVVAGLRVAGYRWFPSDFRPPVAWIAVLLVGVPVFAVLVTMLGMRRLIVSPLGIVRRQRGRRRSAIWPVLLCGGLAALGLGAAGSRELMRWPSPIPGLAIAGALTATLVGLAGTAGWLGWSASGAIARRSFSPAWLLGARRLESDPSAVGRVVSALAVLLAVVGVAQAIALSVARDPGGTFVASWAQSLPASSLYVRDAEGRANADVFLGLRTIPGVRSVSLTRLIPTGGTGIRGSAAVVATDGSADTLQKIRVALAWQASVDTASSLHASDATQSTQALRFGRMMDFITLLVFLVTAAGLLVTTVDGMMERRRPLATLSAIGVPASVLRRSVAVQLGIPLAAAIILGSTAAIVVTDLLFRAIGERIVVPVAALTITAAAAVVMVGFVTAVSLPWVRISRRPELLRNE